MKKLKFGLFVVFGFSFLSQVFGYYYPSSTDTSELKNLKETLSQITSGSMLDTRNFYDQIENLREQFSGDDKLNYMLGELSSHMITKLSIEKNKIRPTTKEFKSGFVNQYISGINIEVDEKAPCTGRYNTLDNISFANNFPTALTIATRYRETSCGYYLPNNGDGPFQILSKDYGTGAITRGKFTQAVQDFIDFSKSKWTQYKTKLGINMTYTGWDYTGFINHAGLYNGGIISGDVVNPLAPKYVWDGYDTYTGAVRYGLFPKFLKILDWEVKNTY